MTCNGKGQFGFGGTIGFEKIIGWKMQMLVFGRMIIFR